MSLGLPESRFFADTTGLAGLRSSERVNTPEAAREVAQQFEALFIQMMIKEMRSASISSGLFDSHQMDTYQAMHDQQLALDMARSGGLGLADVMVEQMTPRPPGQGRALDGQPLPIDWSRAVLPPPVTRLPPSDRIVSAASSSSTASGAVTATNQSREAQSASQSSSAGRGVTRAPVFDGPADFVATLAPLAERAAAQLNVPADAIIAQSALETGWGRHVMHHEDGRPAWALFGIKASADWEGETVTVMTTEVIDGEIIQERARFRAYPSAEAAVEDYARFLASRPRYAEVLGSGNDPYRFASALQQAGYATDPEYAAKIVRIVGSVRPHWPSSS